MMSPHSFHRLRQVFPKRKPVVNHHSIMRWSPSSSYIRLVISMFETYSRDPVPDPANGSVTRPHQFIQVFSPYHQGNIVRKSISNYQHNSFNLFF